MPTKLLTVFAALVSMLLVCIPVSARTLQLPRIALDAGATVQAPALADIGPALLLQLRSFKPAAVVVPAATSLVRSDENITDLRKALIGMAMKLRSIRYVYGGQNPATGFDCSGFVRYVFAQAAGMHLPRNSAAQYRAGRKITRADLKPGDLVFFHTHGRRHRVTHVGIYISDGRFIHSPTSGKSVEISSLHNAYWARHFVGAKRPQAMALVADHG